MNFKSRFFGFFQLLPVGYLEAIEVRSNLERIEG